MSPLRPLAALGLVALLGACGSGTGTTGATGSTGVGTSPSASASSPTTTTGSTDPENPVDPGGGQGRLVTVTGTLSEGVEKGCLLLVPDAGSPGGPWQLMGNVAGLEAGQKVTVRGSRVDNAMTTCQQGRPFDVQAVVTG